MPLVWKKEEGTWQTLPAAGFADERALHERIEEAPHTLPLSGQPDLVILGSEVRLGNLYADLVAVERSGRVVVIEVKLERNAEARRSIVAQVLSYASLLRGLTVSDFEALLKPTLQAKGYASLVQALEGTDQERSFNREVFLEALRSNLTEGAFRLVMVLDGAPSELVRIAGYMEGVAGKLVVDVIVVSSYQVGQATIMVPERIDPGREPREPAVQASAAASGTLSEGADAFEKTIELAEESDRPKLRMLLGWARKLEAEGLVNLFTYSGVSRRWTLLPRLPRENAGLVTIWNEPGASLQFWRSVFERTAPSFVPRVEAKLGATIGKGTPTVYDFDDELLELLTQAYRSANQAG